MKNIEDIENIGKSPSSVIRLSDGQWRIEILGQQTAEVWDIETPEMLLLTASGALVFVNNLGEVDEIVGGASLVKAKRGPL